MSWKTLNPTKTAWKQEERKKANGKNDLWKKARKGVEEKSLWVIEKCSAVTTDYYKWIVSM